MYSLGVFFFILILVYYYFGKKKINSLATVGYKMTLILSYLALCTSLAIYHLISNTRLWNNCQNLYFHIIIHLRNRKHVPFFYRGIEHDWEEEKCCGNKSRRQLFQLLPISFRKYRDVKKKIHLFTSTIKM